MDKECCPSKVAHQHPLAGCQKRTQIHTHPASIIIQFCLVCTCPGVIVSVVNTNVLKVLLSKLTFVHFLGYSYKQPQHAQCHIVDGEFSNAAPWLNFGLHAEELCCLLNSARCYSQQCSPSALKSRDHEVTVFSTHGTMTHWTIYQHIGPLSWLL